MTHSSKSSSQFFRFWPRLLLTSVALLKATSVAQAAGSPTLLPQEQWGNLDLPAEQELQRDVGALANHPAPTAISTPEPIAVGSVRTFGGGGAAPPARGGTPASRPDQPFNGYTNQPEALNQEETPLKQSLSPISTGEPGEPAPAVPTGELQPPPKPVLVAQITPDSTLGNESSIVLPTTIQGIPTDQIEGGAVRGGNLFHSFSQFNVQEGRGAYFSNPAGIQNIFSRVTGADPSLIMGRLGVLGNANLYLVNPNGIIFGPNATLDVKGSFIGTTASSIPFGSSGVFSASDPASSTLLAVEPSALFLNSLSSQAGSIINQAELSVGKSLELIGKTVTSTGSIIAPNGQVRLLAAENTTVRQISAQSAQLLAANNVILEESKLQTTGNLTIIADNTLWIRDSVQTPFLAQSGGNLYLQGTQAIDILALNHPQTPFQSGGNLTLVSNGNVSGDAHYYAGGNFSILNQAGQPGTFVSLYDPIISSNGNVTFGSYTGVSLKVEAKGSITVTGDIKITGKDETFGGAGIVQAIGNVGMSTGENKTFVSATANTTPGSVSVGALENYLEADGQSLDGKLAALGNGTPTTGSAIKVQFTLDKATKGAQDGDPATPTVEDVEFNWTFSSNDGGTFNDFAFYTVSGPEQYYEVKDGQEVAKSANQAVTLATANNGINQGTQTLVLKNSDVAKSASFVLGVGVVNVADGLVNSQVTVSFSKPALTVSSDPDMPTLGSSAALILKAGVPTLLNAPAMSLDSSKTESGTEFTTPADAPITPATLTLKGSINTASGGGGPVILQAPGNITVENSTIETAGTSIGGFIDIKTTSGGDIKLTNSNFYTIPSSGNAGGVTIDANGKVSIQNSYFGTYASGANGGDVIIKSASTSEDPNAPAIEIINTTIDPALNAKLNGKVEITAPNGLIEICANTNCDGSGFGGYIYADVFNAPKDRKAEPINIAGKSVTLSGYQLYAGVSSGTEGSGADVLITGASTLKLLNTQINTSVGSDAVGKGGDITLKGSLITVSGSSFNAQVLANGIGNGGKISIQGVTEGFSNLQLLSNTQMNTSVGSNATGLGGDIVLKGNSMTISSSSLKAEVLANGIGNGGKIIIQNFADLTLQSGAKISTVVASTGQGLGGDIVVSSTIDNSKVWLQGASSLDASTFSTVAVDKGWGGKIDIDVKGQVLLEGASSIQTAAKKSENQAPLAKGGDLDIKAAQISLKNFSLLNASTEGAGISGSFNLNTATLSLDNSTITASAIDSQAGNVLVNWNAPPATLVELKGKSEISVEATGTGTAGSVILNTQKLSLAGNSASEQSLISASTNSGIGQQSIVLQNVDILDVAYGKIEATTITGTAGSILLNYQLDTNTLGAPASAVTLNNATLSVEANGVGGKAGSVLLNTQKLDLTDSSIKASTFVGKAGSLWVTANNSPTTSINLTNSQIFLSNVASTEGGALVLDTQNLTLTNSVIEASTTTGTAGNLIVKAGSNPTSSINLLGKSEISLEAKDTGTAGSIFLNTQILNLTGNSADKPATITAETNSGVGQNITLINLQSLNVIFGKISASTVTGKAGSLTLNQGGTSANSVFLQNANLSLAATGSDGTGTAGSIFLNALNLTLLNSNISTASASTSPFGNAGFITGSVQQLSLQNSSIKASTVGGKSGDISFLTLNTLTSNNSEISTSTVDGQSGKLALFASQLVSLTNQGGLFARATGELGTAGSIQLIANQLFITNGAEISTSTAGQGSAGNIKLYVSDTLTLTNGKINTLSTGTGNAGLTEIQTTFLKAEAGSEISAESLKGGGGQILIYAKDIRLKGSSPILSSVLDGNGNGGNITIESFVFLALEDSDILANAEFGDGGRIIINAPAFIADIFALVQKNPGSFNIFRNNGRVDISASSSFGVSGIVKVPDFSFLQNSLADLSNNFVNPDQIVAKSCLARQNAQQGSFTVTGTGGLAQTPYDQQAGVYDLTGVQSIGGSGGSSLPPQSIAPPEQIIASSVQEAQGIVRTSDGRTTLGISPELAQIQGAEELVCQN